MKVYINYKNINGEYSSVVVEAESLETTDVINALIPEIRTRKIIEVLEVFEDDEDPYADYRITPED